MTIYGPYSPIKKADNFYFVSGQVGIDPISKSATDDITGQTIQALDNLKAVLELNSLSMRKVVKTTIYLKNMSDFAKMNEVYVSYFNEPRPARACVEVAGLPNLAENELLIEIEAVAHKP